MRVNRVQAYNSRVPQKLSAVKILAVTLLSAFLIAFGLAVTPEPAHAAPATEIVLEFEVTNLDPSAGDAVAQVGFGGDLVGVTIDWGDGTIDSIPDAVAAPTAYYNHTFETTGTKAVTIAATTLTSFGHCDNFPASWVNLKKIVSWSSDSLTSLRCLGAYRTGLTQVPSTLPNTAITNLSNAFYLAPNFNQNLNDWDTSKVIDMSSTFTGASVFNNGGAAFTWDTSSVTNMTAMFAHTSAFNQDISGWNTTSVTSMLNMFSNASAFNQPLNTNTTNGTWVTSNVNYFNGMFNNATAFNQDISGWDVSNGTDFSDMFSGASLFNQPIGSWKTSSVTAMTDMFNHAHAFNQSLADWNISQVASFDSFFVDTALDSTNYSATLVGWASRPVLPGMRLNAVGIEAIGCPALVARASLMSSPNNWLISDGTPATDASECIIPVTPTATLANTGASMLVGVILGIALFAGGLIAVGLVIVFRRRALSTPTPESADNKTKD